MKGTFAIASIVAVFMLGVQSLAQSQTIDVDSAVAFSQQIRTVANIVYLRANGWEGRLDVYAQRNPSPTPTVLFFHGGGWTMGAKETVVPSLLPWLAMGYSVVNIEYRLANVSLAPAAIEDSRCALRWVYANAKEYGFDTTRLITTGQSAGAHLALMTGLVPISAGFDRLCLTVAEPKVSAIVNFYNQPRREEVAKAASPLTYVRPGIPPIISIQGDRDPTVPYAHSTRLHEALKKAGVPNEHLTIPGGLHGGFSLDQMQHAFERIAAFLKTNGPGIVRH
jgi:acetyl esterase/lipase